MKRPKHSREEKRKNPNFHVKKEQVGGGSELAMAHFRIACKSRAAGNSEGQTVSSAGRGDGKQSVAE